MLGSLGTLLSTRECKKESHHTLLRITQKAKGKQGKDEKNEGRFKLQVMRLSGPYYSHENTKKKAIIRFTNHTEGQRKTR